MVPVKAGAVNSLQRYSFHSSDRTQSTLPPEWTSWFTPLQSGSPGYKISCFANRTVMAIWQAVPSTAQTSSGDRSHYLHLSLDGTTLRTLCQSTVLCIQPPNYWKTITKNPMPLSRDCLVFFGSCPISFGKLAVNFGWCLATLSSLLTFQPLFPQLPGSYLSKDVLPLAIV